MNDKQKTKKSKFLSLVLRHEPSRIGITLDPAGWVEAGLLLANCAQHGISITRDELEEIVVTNEKKRFAFSDDGMRIRANQGHSVEIELGYECKIPPTVLYHGTSLGFLEQIRGTGLKKRSRHHMHLSEEPATAFSVGSRHGKPVVLKIRAGAMHEAGYLFMLSDNGVWLADHVPVEFLEFPTEVPTLPQSRTKKRSRRAEMANETISICEAGFYEAANGRKVTLKQWIEDAKSGSQLFTPDRLPERQVQAPVACQIFVTNETTTHAARRLCQIPNAHVGALNFASAKNPGGGFLGGAEAQEEALARASALYPCLLTVPEYYELNRATHSSLYLDQVIYSPRVPFFRDDEGEPIETPFLVSMLTSPAPNAGALAVNEPEALSRVPSCLLRRTDLVLQVAAVKKVTHLILGAWGCGVFRNDPVMVADCFAQLLETNFKECFEQVVFAIYDRTSEQAVLTAFRTRFESQAQANDAAAT